MTKRDAPATRRNREPILEVLTRWLIGPARVLEVASGTGQHAAFFASRLPQVDWQPTDLDGTTHESIRAWATEEKAGNLREPLVLDASRSDWPVDEGSFDAVFSANMIHIAPWPACLGLLAGAARVLKPGGHLLLYGPFKLGDEHTAPSNASFDASLRERDHRWGIRDLEEVVSIAGAEGLVHEETNELPANNELIVFTRAPKESVRDD